MTDLIPPIPAAPRGRVVVFGIMIWYPLAGVTYQFLHYLLGLRRLGYDVYYVEDTLADVYDPTLNEFTSDATRNIDAVRPVLEAYGFADRWAYHIPAGGWAGLPEADVRRLFREADACLNVTGAHELREEHMAVPRRLYVESDPFAMQVRVAKGEERTIRFLDAHTHFFSFGENLGRDGCTVPIERYRWQPTRQPVDLPLWNTPGPGGSTYTTITTWHNKGEGMEWRGDRYYWTKDREFLKFIDLPRRRPVALELATSVDEAVQNLLTENGWRRRDAVDLSRDADAYRRYIQASRAEFTVARDQYTRPGTGWSSDRSVCYLAAGRPVITQDTGFGRTIPVGRGLFAYSDMNGILAAVDAIESDYAGQCEAARQIAAEYFGAEVVLRDLLSRVGM